MSVFALPEFQPDAEFSAAGELFAGSETPFSDTPELPPYDFRLRPALPLNFKLLAVKHPFKGVWLNFKDGFEVRQSIKEFKKFVKRLPR